MRKTKHAAMAAIITLCCHSAFAQAQCFNTEEQYVQKVRDMQEQCGKIIGIVPCAMGYVAEYKYEDLVLRQADDAALVNLAASVEAFVEYHSTDSIIDGDVEKRLRENVSKVKVKLRLNNTFAFPGECVAFTKDGKTLYRGASLRVLNRELYNEALADVNKIEKEETAPSSSPVAATPSVSAADMQANAIKQSAEPPKISIPKQIARAAKKHAPLAGKFLLGVLGL